MATNGMAQKVYIGIVIALACAVVCGWVTVTSDVRANTTTLMHFQRRADKIETAIQGQAKDLTAIKIDIGEMRTILERMEKE